MKHLFLFSVLLFLANNSFAQQTLTKTFDPTGHNNIDIAVKSKSFEVSESSNKVFTVDIEIKVNYPKPVIDELIKIGRYKLTNFTAARGSYTISAAELKKPVTVGGKALTEEIKIKVSTPPHYFQNDRIIQKDESLKTIREPININIRFVYAVEPSTAAGDPNNMGAINDGKTVEPTGPKQVQAMYGDILMGSLPLDDFYD